MRIKIAALLGLATIIGAGCAGTGGLSQSARESIKGKPLHAVHTKANYFTDTSAGRNLAIGGAVSAIADNAIGEKNRKKYQLQDPAVTIKTILAEDLASVLGASTVKIVEAEQPQSMNSPEELRTLCPEGGIVLHVQTTYWGMSYFATHWNQYQVLYSAFARVVDLDAGKVLTTAFIRVNDDYKEDAPNRDQILANNAELLKANLATLAEEARAQLKAKLLE